MWYVEVWLLVNHAVEIKQTTKMESFPELMDVGINEVTWLFLGRLINYLVGRFRASSLNIYNLLNTKEELIELIISLRSN